jgi:CheY-like chemotaxis protein
MQKLTCTLLVDDDTVTNYINRKLLERLHVTDKILVAEDGQQALALVVEHCETVTPDCPALILLDVNMPVMDGFEFLEEYAKLPLAHRQDAIIIVMLTTSLHPQDVQRVSELSIAGFLNKPLNREKVNEVLQAHFSRHLSED